MTRQPRANEIEAGRDREAISREVLGYLNLSEGRPDPRFERNINQLYGLAFEAGAGQPWQQIRAWLGDALAALRGTTPVFRDAEQAEAVLAVSFDAVLPGYREHHRDLLAHLSDAELWQPFFLARVFEAVLAQGGPWHERDRVARDAIRRLNDFIGHRPIAVLENRQRSEPYEHERVRPIPLYIRGAGVACGKYFDIIRRALEILERTDPDIRARAQFDFGLLDELALDPRAYDFNHPVNQRPNYQFGEWDPHHLDNQGRYRRFVLRQVALDALLARVETAAGHADSASRDELLLEAAAVLAGIMLMASGVSGGGPDTHDSSVTLEKLVPGIAGYRDEFYDRLLKSVGGTHGGRLRREAELTHQPFGGARQHLNQYLARQRATQLQHVQLARLFAQIGYADAAREQARVVPTASARITSELQSCITACHLSLDRGSLVEAATAAAPLADLLERGIASGALADPWNILGFQGQFSIFAALENSVPDGRVDQLTELMEQIFAVFARLQCAAAAAGNTRLEQAAAGDLRRLAAWWDQFATIEVAGVRRVLGQEAVDAAQHVARALAAWRRGGQLAGDIAFWRQHSDGFNSPRAYAQVVEALLAQRDHVAAMGLLMQWLSQAAHVPLADGPDSFHKLAVRWLRDVLDPETTQAVALARARLIQKFFDYLEANAEDLWQVPALELGANITNAPAAAAEASEDELYAAAYEDVSFRDSAADGYEGEVLEGGPQREEFVLDAIAERIEPRLQFLSTVATLWRMAAAEWPDQHSNQSTEMIESWLKQARGNKLALAKLLEAAHQHTIPQPLGSPESMIEFDRRQVLKENLTHEVIAATVEMAQTARQLSNCLPHAAPAAGPAEWELLALELERAIARGDVAGLREKLPGFLKVLAAQPLLYRPLSKGGQPHEIVAAKCIQQFLHSLVQSLPQAGLLRETYHVLRTARRMEHRHPVAGQAITEFDRLFAAGFREAVESFLAAAQAWEPAQRADAPLLACLEEMTEPFLRLWLEHSQTLRLSTLERISGEHEWNELRRFIETYGHDLLTPKFLTLANIRAILDQGADRYLEYLQENQDPLHPVRLAEDFGDRISREDARRLLEFVLRAFVENYEEYKDYNSTATQSDYGERFFVLLEFLRIKSWYDRASWNLQPVALAHEILARTGRTEAARLWQEAMREKTRPIAEGLLAKLAELEAAYGVRLATVADRLEERFVRPLELDRVRVLIEPSMRQAREPQPATTTAFAELRRELLAFAQTPTGVGWDVPHWIRVLEHEVRRVRAQQAMPTEPPHASTRLTRKHLPFEDLRQQLETWDQPL